MYKGDGKKIGFLLGFNSFMSCGSRRNLNASGLKWREAGNGLDLIRDVQMPMISMKSYGNKCIYGHVLLQNNFRIPVYVLIKTPR